MSRVLSLMLVLAAMSAVVPSIASAQARPGPVASVPLAQAEGGSAVRAGKNLGEIVKSWGGALLLGVAGIMGLAALAKRNLSEGLTLMALVVLVGGFIFADTAVKSFVESLWGAVSGG